MSQLSVTGGQFYRYTQLQIVTNMANGRRLLFSSLLFLFGCSSLFGQQYPVPAMEVNMSFSAEYRKPIQVQSFVISDLITVAEFKAYLAEIKRDSSLTFYKSQLPSSRTITEVFVDELLKNNDLQDKPMPGVSWSVAQQYCKWLNQQSATKGLNYTYNLPFVSELIAFDQLYGSGSQQLLECWTQNSYDESIFEFTQTFDYQYDAQAFDPPAMKRKVIFGGSYHMNYDNAGALRTFQYEYQDSSSRYVGFRIVRRLAQSVSQQIKLDKVHAHVTLNNNQLDGVYRETYFNGKTKVLGQFSHGQRVGIWTVWDENGMLKLQREYTSNKVCDFQFPVVANPYEALYEKYPEYTLTRNGEQLYPYLPVEERTVVYTQRTWRELSTENEPDLFQQINMQSLIKALFDAKTKWFYYGNSGDFRTEVPADSLPNLKVMAQSWDVNRMEIKEDFFFNMDNLLSDTRQVGMSFYKNSTDSKPAYSVYFPHIRKALSQTKLTLPETEAIKTLDDLFFFHAYRGMIVHRSSLWDRSDNTDPKENDLIFEVEKFASEHDLWLLYGR